jgi:voltage-gated sodium channel
LPRLDVCPAFTGEFFAPCAPACGRLRIQVPITSLSKNGRGITVFAISRDNAGRWIESSAIQNVIIGLILLNAVTLGLETSADIRAQFGAVLHFLDTLVLAVFVVEIITKLYAFGWRFFRNPWNVFDFVIVAIALIPASGPLAVLRVLRILRVLRLISMIPRLRMVVEALLMAIPGIASIAGLMLILYYVFAVMATGLFGADHAEWFGTIGRSMYTLFQIMTLESWSMGIARPVMVTHPYAWVFFVPFILIATFTMLNLFIAIIVNTMQTMHAQSHQEEQAAIEQAVHDDRKSLQEELRSVREEIRQLRDLLQKSKP